jgi:predicted nucleotidyltransferase
MTTPSPNRAALEAVAIVLGSLREELVFVGGQVAELLITDPVAIRIRPTDDVDVLVSAATRMSYHQFGEKLRSRYFREDTRESAPLCRWRHGAELVLDVMPLNEGVLGFTNRWYEHAFATAREIELARGLTIRIVTGPAFLATKWVAFDSRGQADHLGSHDVEDIVTVVAGRPELPDEISTEADGLRTWLSERTARFLAHPDAEYAIEGALPDARHDPRIIATVRERFAAIASAHSA